MRPENAKESTKGTTKESAKAHAPTADLPPLELLRSFEAAARTLSFTLAAGELHLTQSAVSRQIQQLEASVGTLLFERGHRSLSLTESGGVLQRAVIDSLERLRDATARLRAAPALRQVAITSTPGFASFWLIPRLARFTAAHPDVDVRVSATLDVLDLERSRIDVAVRFVATQNGIGAALFDESVEPLCSPQLIRSGAHPLRVPADLVHHTLLTMETPGSMAPTVDWEPWQALMGLPELRMKNTLRFTLYTDAVNAAVAGQGVVIGRLPLLDAFLRDGRLVAPFGQSASTRRGHYIETSRRAAGNPDAQDFVRWLRAEADADANAARG
jgi:LysR family glycine cleavage system transcriptional activator